MAEIKLTKSELRLQQRRHSQLQKYLPTLQLKKAMLQAEVNEARLLIEECRKEVEALQSEVDTFAALLTERTALDFRQVARILKVDKTYDNIAGIEVPSLLAVVFGPVAYSLFDTPAWVDSAVVSLRRLVESRLRLEVAHEKKNALEEELRQVSIRVNLFEKVLIPRATAHIKKIRVFLGDQELSAVGRAKVAKAKIKRAIPVVNFSREF